MFAEGSVNDLQKERNVMTQELCISGAQRVTNSGCDPSTVPESLSLPSPQWDQLPYTDLLVPKVPEERCNWVTCDTAVTHQKPCNTFDIH